MKIIHCSDIHLDSRMEHNLTAAQARERNAEILATFSRMADFAQQQGVEAVLLAGDLFDTERVTPRTAGFVLDRIRKLPGVEFFYLRGNHDESADVIADMDIPENFRTFGREWVSYDRGEVVITGLELDRENWACMYEDLKLDPEKTNIVMLHGQTAHQMGEELIALPRLKNKNIDYLALGHIHSFQEGTLDDRGSWCYCGCLEGRGFDECAQKGFVLLDVSDGSIRREFVPFAQRTLHEVEVDITDLVTVDQLLDAMRSASRQIPEKDLVKYVLRGGYTLQTQKDLTFLKKMTEGKFYFSRIKDESSLKIDPETYANDISLKGEFIRLVMASDRPQEEKDRIILLGIRALTGEEVAL